MSLYNHLRIEKETGIRHMQIMFSNAREKLFKFDTFFYLSFYIQLSAWSESIVGCDLTCFLRDSEAFTRDETVLVCTWNRKRSPSYTRESRFSRIRRTCAEIELNPSIQYTCEAQCDNIYLSNLFTDLFVRSPFNSFQFNYFLSLTNNIFLKNALQCNAFQFCNVKMFKDIRFYSESIFPSICSMYS